MYHTFLEPVATVTIAATMTHHRAAVTTNPIVVIATRARGVVRTPATGSSGASAPDRAVETRTTSHQHRSAAAIICNSNTSSRHHSVHPATPNHHR